MPGNLVSEYRGFRIQTEVSLNGQKFSGVYRITNLSGGGIRLGGRSAGEYAKEASAHGAAYQEASQTIDTLMPESSPTVVEFGEDTGE
jgi:hypothetical protein